MCLADFGWTSYFSEQFEQFRGPGIAAGRVTQVDRGSCIVQSVRGEARARLRSRATAESVVVGDWVAHRPVEERFSVIEALLPRRTKLSRTEPGDRSREQVLAANVDTVVLMMGHDGDFNLRRMERLLVVARESRAACLVVLNKRELSTDPEGQRRQVEELVTGVPVVQISARTGEGLVELIPHLRARATFVLIGSSGVGKSTLVNQLLGRELLRTSPVRPGDSRGRHTTSRRQLFRLNSGALVIDSPGLREVELWASDDSLEGTFQDVLDLGRRCRFGDCSHRTEPGCAVLDAVRAGRLDRNRFESYLKLRRELNYLEKRQDQSARLAERRRWKIIHKSLRQDRKRGY